MDKRKNMNIRIHMLKHGLTQKSMAELLKINAVTLNYKLNGKNEFTQLELTKMSEIFNVSIDELVKE